MEAMRDYLLVTPVIDFDNRLVRAFAEKHVSGSAGQSQEAIALYYAVRDMFRYDPYTLDLSVKGMRASTTLQNGYGWCVSKAVLLAACCRSRGIPARLGFGDVRNHISTRRLREWMQTDVFYWHGYTDIYLNERWVKATPAFNRSLCEKFGIKPLEFDGLNDSIFHPFDTSGNRHMEYINDRGTFADLPLDAILTSFENHYGRLLERKTGDFHTDAGREAVHLS